MESPEFRQQHQTADVDDQSTRANNDEFLDAPNDTTVDRLRGAGLQSNQVGGVLLSSVSQMERAVRLNSRVDHIQIDRPMTDII